MSAGTHEAGELTRLEVARAVGDAFGPQPVDRTVLILTAERSGARAEVMTVLRRLGARRFNDLRELWSQLPEMPVR